MKIVFYLRLAASNFKNNAKLYIPYILISLFNVSMYYILHSLSGNDGLKNHSTTVSILVCGTYVMLIFSVIFLFYANSFLMKQRKKELGLYHILGMEKKHLMIMMGAETLFASVFTIIAGILTGVLLSRLVYLILLRLIHFDLWMGFEIPLQSISATAVLFFGIFLLTLLSDVFQIKLSNPLDLMKGGTYGEKEPKTKRLLVLLGCLCLGSGYAISQLIAHPEEAFAAFFGAVVLVIAGTYLLFTAGSIAVLKQLKKHKGFYYQTKHFVSVSGMIYRMKQNAAGLASICILCTCVLVTVSSTFSLYASIEDYISKICMADMSGTIYHKDFKSSKEYEKIIRKELSARHISYKELYSCFSYSVVGKQNGQNVETILDTRTDQTMNITAVNLQDYNRIYKTSVSLKENEVLLFSSPDLKFQDSVTLNGMKFHIKSYGHDRKLLFSNNQLASRSAMVFQNDSMIRKALENKNVTLEKGYTFNINVEKGQSLVSFSNDIFRKLYQGSDEFSYVNNTKETIRNETYDLYGGFFFLGIFLGLLFLAAAVLVIYYKQIQEGYEDRARYKVLQEVGMSRQEVKQAIRSQVLIFFFLPPTAAIIHICFAFKIISRLLRTFGFENTNLFILCTFVTILILAAVYTLVYWMTSKTYYHIVRR